MSLSADVTGIDSARLTVLLDVRHPFAYLALGSTTALADALGLDLNWLPLSTQTLKPPSTPAEDDDRGIRHRRSRAKAIAREIETYGDAQGLVLREYYRSGSADAANLGWLWVRSRHPEKLQSYLVELFRSYWSVALDPFSAEQVAALIRSIEPDDTSFVDWSKTEGPKAVAAVAQELTERGLFQVPAYVVADEVFYGRQHLPMIRWILEGRSGPVPI